MTRLRQRGIEDGEAGLHALEQVAVHPVRACAVQPGVAVVLEVEHAGVLEEPADDRVHADVVRHPRDARPQRAGAAHDQVDPHAGLRRAVQGPDDLRLDQRVHLGDDARRSALRRASRLLVDVREHPVVQRERRLEKPREPRGAAEPGELHEHFVHVLADPGIRGQKPEIGVHPGGAGVVVAGSEVHVAAQPLPFAPDHEQHLRVGLVSDHSVDDVRPRLLELFGERDVRLLVEAGPELDADRDLLARSCRRDERFDERRLGAGAVQRLLDGQHVGIGGGLLDEVEHRRERLVGVVQGGCRRPRPLRRCGRTGPFAPGVRA